MQTSLKLLFTVIASFIFLFSWGKPSQAADNCIEQGQACTLYGTPCCGTATCQGTFPNTTCQ